MKKLFKAFTLALSLSFSFSLSSLYAQDEIIKTEKGVDLSWSQRIIKQQSNKAGTETGYLIEVTLKVKNTGSSKVRIVTLIGVNDPGELSDASIISALPADCDSNGNCGLKFIGNLDPGSLKSVKKTKRSSNKNLLLKSNGLSVSILK